MRWTMTTSRRLAAFAACFGLILPVAAAARRDEAAPLRNPVEIDGGRRLNVVCAGERGPSIIFANGLGSSVLDWKQVQAQVARFARACVYDRAGSGYSDPSPQPSSASTMTGRSQTARILRSCATSTAKRVLPAPPGPRTVTKRCAATRASRRAPAWSAPTSRVR